VHIAVEELQHFGREIAGLLAFHGKVLPDATLKR
jgi:hypothetical protein